MDIMKVYKKTYGDAFHKIKWDTTDFSGLSPNVIEIYI